jgi:O-antigen/teichoic acid export membrane protein
MMLLMFFANDILTLWLGADFARHCRLPLQIMAVGILANCLAYIPGALLRAVGRPDVHPKLFLVEVPIYGVLAWFLILKMGIVGAALAYSLRTMLDVGLLLSAVFFLKYTPLRTFVHHGLLRCLVMLGGLGLAFVAVSFWSRGLPVQISLAIALGLIYSIVAWIFLLDGEERQYLVMTCNRFLRRRGEERGGNEPSPLLEER